MQSVMTALLFLLLIFVMEIFVFIWLFKGEKRKDEKKPLTTRRKRDRMTV